MSHYFSTFLLTSRSHSDSVMRANGLPFDSYTKKKNPANIIRRNADGEPLNGEK